MRYKFNYSDGTILEKVFENDTELNDFIHNEGDHLLSYERQKGYLLIKDNKVFFENGVYLGDFLIKDDGFYDFWPEHPSTGGYWPSYVLRELADKLDVLNAPYEKELNEYFENENENEKANS